ncbi:hypothetical protein [Brochothrix phage BtpYZU04]
MPYNKKEILPTQQVKDITALFNEISAFMADYVQQAKLTTDTGLANTTTNINTTTKTGIYSGTLQTIGIPVAKNGVQPTLYFVQETKTEGTSVQLGFAVGSKRTDTPLWFRSVSKGVADVWTTYATSKELVDEIKKVEANTTALSDMIANIYLPKSETNNWQKVATTTANGGTIVYGDVGSKHVSTLPFGTRVITGMKTSNGYPANWSEAVTATVTQVTTTGVRQVCIELQDNTRYYATINAQNSVSGWRRSATDMDIALNQQELLQAVNNIDRNYQQPKITTNVGNPIMQINTGEDVVEKLKELAKGFSYIVIQRGAVNGPPFYFRGTAMVGTAGENLGVSGVCTDGAGYSMSLENGVTSGWKNGSPIEIYSGTADVLGRKYTMTAPIGRFSYYTIYYSWAGSASQSHSSSVRGNSIAEVITAINIPDNTSVTVGCAFAEWGITLEGNTFIVTRGLTTILNTSGKVTREDKTPITIVKIVANY